MSNIQEIKQKIEIIRNDTNSYGFDNDNIVLADTLRMIADLLINSAPHTSQGIASTLRSVLSQGTFAPQPISFLKKEDAEETTNEGDPYGEIGIDPTTYTYFFGKFNKENKNDSAGTFNLQIGYETLGNNLGQYNVGLGHYSLSNNTTGTHNTAVGVSGLNKNTDGSFNVAMGFAAGFSMNKGSRNTFIGINSANKLVRGDSNTFIGSNVGYVKLTSDGVNKDDLVGIAPIYEKYLTGSAKWWNKSIYGFDEATNTLSTSANTFIGSANGENGPTRAVGSISIGVSPMDNILYRNYNNIFIGNMLYTNRNIQVHNSVLIGHHFHPHNHDNILAIHNSKTERVVPTNALIYGEFDTRKLKINGSLTLNPNNAPQANESFNKIVMANDNGDLTFVTVEELKEKLGINQPA